MLLDELVELARILRDRMEKHSELLRANETRTRYALIDPVLTALGWNIHSPDQVVPEFSAGSGRADYALHAGSDETPHVLIEAKKLGTKLEDKLGQAITYCNERGIKYFVVTDGERWKAYETFRPVANPEKLVISFSVSQPMNEFVYGALWLWKGNFEGVAPADAPVHAEDKTESDDPPKTAPDVLPKQDEPGSGWIPISELAVKLGDAPPGQIRFPDQQTRDVAGWVDVQRHVIEWSAERGFLTPELCPITGPGGGFIVNTTAMKKNGKPFDNPAQVPGKDMWWNRFHNAFDQHRMAIIILSRVGVDSKEVMVLVNGI